MSEHEQEETMVGPAGLVNDIVGAGETAPSLRDRLARRREQAAEHRYVDLDIPGYDGEIFCRYNLLDPQRLNGIVTRVTKTTRDPVQRGLWANLDTLIAACDSIWVRTEDGEKPLADLIGSDVPVRYDDQLAEFLKFSAEIAESRSPARAVVIKLFMDNELAVAAHAQRLSRWMTGNESEATDEFLGEM